MIATIQPQTTDPRLLVTPREAARMLSVSERTLWGLTKRGEVPAVRVGVRSVRYSIAALQAWIEAQQTSVNGEK